MKSIPLFHFIYLEMRPINLKSPLTETSPKRSHQGQPADIPGAVVVGAGECGRMDNREWPSSLPPQRASPLAAVRAELGDKGGHGPTCRTVLMFLAPSYQ